jgi:hypothetical protein
MYHTEIFWQLCLHLSALRDHHTSCHFSTWSAATVNEVHSDEAEVMIRGSGDFHGSLCIVLDIFV